MLVEEEFLQLHKFFLLLEKVLMLVEENSSNSTVFSQKKVMQPFSFQSLDLGEL